MTDLYRIPPAVRLKRYAFDVSYGVMPPVSGNGIARKEWYVPPPTHPSSGLVSGAWPNRIPGIRVTKSVFNIQDPGFRTLLRATPKIIPSGSVQTGVSKHSTEVFFRGSKVLKQHTKLHTNKRYIYLYASY